MYVEQRPCAVKPSKNLPGKSLVHIELGPARRMASEGSQPASPMRQRSTTRECVDADDRTILGPRATLLKRRSGQLNPARGKIDRQC